MKGLSVAVYREPAGSGMFDNIDCTNGGISGKFRNLTLVGPGIPGISEATENRPAVMIVERDLPSKRGGRRTYLHAIPVEGKDDTRIGWMFGGNFIYSSDSHFPADYPIPVHDRQE